MWPQVSAIAWAQWRITRNHLPRTSTGSWLMALLGFLWYCAFGAVSLAVLKLFSIVPPSWLRQWLPVCLLGVCAFWQIVPVMTLTGGWSLNLKKLRSFPVPTSALFGIEVLLRLTTAFEMLLLVAGACVGLALNPGIPKPAFLFLLLIIPFNLLLSLGIREFILHSFARNRLREIFALVVISIGLLPQLFVHSSLGARATPYALDLSRGAFFPWAQIALLSSGFYSFRSIAAVLLWTAAVYAFAKVMFLRGLREEETMRPSSNGAVSKATGRNVWESSIDFLARRFPDPLGILVQKELRQLVRMPRFRVIIGMACFFSVMVFFPLSEAKASFMRSNFLEVVALYGMLILSDALFWNIFGFDRSAAQIYFVTPVNVRQVIQAKNLTALIFVAIQNLVVLVMAILLHFISTPLNVLSGFSCSATVTIFFLAAGNISSVTSPRGVDPAQTLKKQTNAQRQLWLLGCSGGMFLLVGLGMLARWATGSEWALIGVLAVEFGIGVIAFRIAMDTAVERALSHREEIINALSKSGSQIAV
jgi:ABC-2 type transport system permease protein